MRSARSGLHLPTIALWLGCLLARGDLRLAFVGAVLIGAGVWRLRAANRSGVVWWCCGALLLCSFFSVHHVATVDAARLAQQASARAFVELSGRAVADARESVGGRWQLYRADQADRQGVRERVVLRWPPGMPALRLGEYARVDGRLRPLARDGFGGYLRQQHAVAELRVADVSDVQAASWLLRAVEQVRERTLAGYRAGLSTESAAILAGLTVGEPPPQQIAQPFDQAGLTHLLVVSGQHMVIALALLLAIGAACRLGFRARRLFALAGVWWLVLLVRPQPSVLRAAFAVSVVVLAQWRGRPDVGLHTLAAIVTVLLLIDPLLAGQTGFLLSVAATAGLLLLVPRLGNALPGPERLRLLLAAALAAQLAVLPILLWRIGEVPLLAVPANVVALPLAGAAQAVGAVSGLVAQAQPQVGARIARLAAPPLWLLHGTARAFARGPTLRLQPQLFSPLWRVLPGRLPDRVHSLALTALDVGQGDALLVDAPGTVATEQRVARMLVDGGADPDAAVALLARLGVTQLDAVVMSHGDLDHSGGLAEVLRQVPVGALLIGPHPPLTPGGPAWQALRMAQARGVPVVRVQAGSVVTLGSAEVEILSPPRDGFVGAPANEHSLIMRITGPGGRILLTGDSEVLAQEALLAHPSKLRADVLKVPHHGGNTNADRFLAAVGAQIAVLSVGASNTYGHPHPDVLAALHGLQIRRTDLEGTVRIVLDPATLHPLRTSRLDCGHGSAPRVSVCWPRGAVAPAGRRSPIGRTA